ncbi:hypothetical protein BDY19DRAFT_909000 [Irpex rosettiformis]|uniref:Uncharacterized protein n=1 Tax=Irpex rosettiformis TaxID=378272 RepID=A0ACB8TUN3_9APHY|nr:hypothetical protein BDY19DRAFT_909000 [Irpex rosettiformis]
MVHGPPMPPGPLVSFEGVSPQVLSLSPTTFYAPPNPPLHPCSAPVGNAINPWSSQCGLVSGLEALCSSARNSKSVAAVYLKSIPAGSVDKKKTRQPGKRLSRSYARKLTA